MKDYDKKKISIEIKSYAFLFYAITHVHLFHDRKTKSLYHYNILVINYLINLKLIW